MTLRDVAERIGYITTTTSAWGNYPECKEEVQIDYSEMRDALADLRLDIERYLLKTEGKL